MSQRLNEMNWIWSILVIYFGQTWSPVSGGALPNQPKPSATGVIESQAKFFQYRHLPTSEDFDQGHRLGSSQHFTERHERSRPSAGLYNAKVRWGDKKGGYGEHYWDLNHAGHNNDHDDGEYHADDDSYDESSEQSSNYEDIQKDTNEETERRKRAHTNSSKEHRTISHDENKERTQKKQKILQEPSKRVKNDIVLIVNERDRAVREPKTFLEPPNQDLELRQNPGSIRQPSDLRQNPGSDRKPSDLRQNPGLVLQPSSQPRLYFEPTTGHVIDRGTGQAFFLQPIVVN
ncbi:uncharacterized protein LOC110991972 isoform X2 [Pieris rapae]|uniref:uncharacterized protein LOC110991972 isoform X2 n=1 Tax=Pieris rapae TaxID=64459 RepID=UPI001E27A05D|nr:uncharacterized protein LOC110991972 isoform X2 [Pieris rapae]